MPIDREPVFAAHEGPPRSELDRMQAAYDGAPMTRLMLGRLNDDIRRLLIADDADGQLSLERQEALVYLVMVRQQFVNLQHGRPPGSPLT